MKCKTLEPNTQLVLICVIMLASFAAVLICTCAELSVKTDRQMDGRKSFDIIFFLPQRLPHCLHVCPPISALPPSPPLCLHLSASADSTLHANLSCSTKHRLV